MAELRKQWTTGDGSLTATYDGSGDGSAVFTSTTNEGVDREMNVAFVDASRSIVIERKVSQEGLREIFEEGFILADGGTFNVLKELSSSITFTISYAGGYEVDTYTAVEGMTWGEFVNSSYNVLGSESFGYIENIGNSFINSNNGGIVYTQDGEEVVQSDLIIANEIYIGM